MSKICVVSGLPTESLYKNQPIHPDVMALARHLMEDEGMSMSQALRAISYNIVMSIRTKLENGEVPNE